MENNIAEPVRPSETSSPQIQSPQNVPSGIGSKRNILVIAGLIFLMAIVGAGAYYLGVTKSVKTSQISQPALNTQPTPTTYSQDNFSKNQVYKVVFTKGGDIWIVNDDGTNAKQLTQYGANFNPLLSPSGDHIAYYSLDASTKQNVLSQTSEYDNTKVNFWTIKTDGSNPVRLTESNLSAHRSSLSWSPTGKQLVYIEDTKVITIDADGANKKIIADLNSSSKLITTYPNSHTAIWSPNGNRIAVYGQTRTAEGEGDDGSPKLLIFNLDGKLLNTYFKGILPSWWSMPDDIIYYAEGTNGIGLYALWQSKIDGSSPKLISGTTTLSRTEESSVSQAAIYGASSFVFSQDGKMVATIRDEWYSESKTTSPLWIMNIDGSNSHPVTLPSQISDQLKSSQLTSNNGSDMTSLRVVKWLPDNQHLVLQVYTTGFGSAVGKSTDRSSLYSIKIDGTELKVLDSSHPVAIKAPYIIRDDEVSTGVELLH